MDKQTLSNYGWIVVVTLVLAVMIAVATPFSDFIGKNVQNTTEALFKAEDNAMDKVLENMGIIPSVEELQKEYKFEYYSTLNKAFADVNADEIGATADSNETDGVAGIYVDEKGIPNVVLLKDATETEVLKPTTDMTLNLGGNTLTLTNSSATNLIEGTEGNTSTFTIDGRLKNSEINVPRENSTITTTVLLRAYDSNTFIINGGTYNVKSSVNAVFAAINPGSKMIIESITANTICETGITYCIQNKGSIDINNSNINASVTNTEKKGTTVSACAIFNNSGDINIDNCNLFASSVKIAEYTSASSTYYTLPYAVYSIDSDTNIKNSKCYINNRTTNPTNGKVLLGNGSGIKGTNSNLNIINCDIKGAHSGIVAGQGTKLYINGGNYESCNHGGIYFGQGPDGEAYVENATIKYNKFVASDGSGYSNGTAYAAFYIGGAPSSSDATKYSNMEIYMNNCDIINMGDGAHEGTIVFRGSAGEKNNKLYISNSRIQSWEEKSIRIDGSKNYLYIGQGCNFTANNVDPTYCDDINACVTITDEIYVKP